MNSGRFNCNETVFNAYVDYFAKNKENIQIKKKYPQASASTAPALRFL